MQIVQYDPATESELARLNADLKVRDALAEGIKVVNNKFYIFFADEVHGLTLKDQINVVSAAVADIQKNLIGSELELVYWQWREEQKHGNKESQIEVTTKRSQCERQIETYRKQVELYRTFIGQLQTGAVTV